MPLDPSTIRQQFPSLDRPAGKPASGPLHTGGRVVPAAA